MRLTDAELLCNGCLTRRAGECANSGRHLGVHFATRPAAGVFRHRHRLQVRRVYARLDSAQMINCQPVRDGSTITLEVPAAGSLVPPLVPEIGVAGDQLPLPNPARRLVSAILDNVPIRWSPAPSSVLIRELQPARSAPRRRLIAHRRSAVFARVIWDRLGAHRQGPFLMVSRPRPLQRCGGIRYPQFYQNGGYPL